MERNQFLFQCNLSFEWCVIRTDEFVTLSNAEIFMQNDSSFTRGSEISDRFMATDRENLSFRNGSSYTERLMETDEDDSNFAESESVNTECLMETDDIDSKFASGSENTEYLMETDEDESKFSSESVKTESLMETDEDDSTFSNGSENTECLMETDYINSKFAIESSNTECLMETDEELSDCTHAYNFVEKGAHLTKCFNSEIFMEIDETNRNIVHPAKTESLIEILFQHTPTSGEVLGTIQQTISTSCNISFSNKVHEF